MKTQAVAFKSRKLVTWCLLLMIAAFGAAGCKKKKEGKALFMEPKMDPNGCLWNGMYLRGDLATKCCNGGVLKTVDVPPECPAEGIGDDAVNCVMESFTSAFDIGKQTTDTSTTLVGTTPVVTPTSPTTPITDGTTVSGITTTTSPGLNTTTGTTDGSLANTQGTSAALGSNNGLVAMNKPGNSLLDDLKNKVGQFMTGNGNGSGGGYGGNTGGGGGGYGGGVSTAPSGQDSNAAKSGLADSGTGSMGAYGGGSGGAGAGGGGGGFNPFGSSGSGGGGDRGPAGLSFGKEGDGQNASTMASADPDNYFNLLGVHDNLFKVVERRYTSKSKSWALSDAERAAQSVNSVKK